MAQENDLVLIYFEDKPLVYARIEEILPDSKPTWYHVTLLLLQTPLQEVTWILREVYINGAEFTMNGKRMRLEKVQRPAKPPKRIPEEKTPDKEKPIAKKNTAKVISITDLKKK